MVGQASLPGGARLGPGGAVITPPLRLGWVAGLLRLWCTPAGPAVVRNSLRRRSGPRGVALIAPFGAPAVDSRASRQKEVERKTREGQTTRARGAAWRSTSGARSGQGVAAGRRASWGPRGGCPGAPPEKSTRPCGWYPLRARLRRGRRSKAASKGWPAKVKKGEGKCINP